MSELLLRVTAPGFCAGAVFKKTSTGWRCVRAAPILYKMLIGKSPSEVLRTCLSGRRGWLWEWR